jgi:hypothetical protein
MNLDEFFESELSLKRTIWTKRGENITKREVKHLSLTDITPRTRVQTIIKEKTND